MEQLCWKCANCTSLHKCSWVKKYQYPEGVELDDEGYITSCPQFVDDGLVHDPRKTISEFFGVAVRTYDLYKLWFDRCFEKYGHIKDAPTIKQMSDFFKIGKITIREKYDYYLRIYLTLFGKSV